MITFSGKQGISVTPNKVSNVKISDDQIRLAREICLDKDRLGHKKLGSPQIVGRLKRRANQAWIGQGLGT